MDLNLIYVLVSIIVILGLTIFGVPWLQKRKLINDDTLQLASDLLLALKIITDKNVKNESDKETVNKIVQVIRGVLEYVGSVSSLPTPQEKAVFAKAEIISQLKILDVIVDYETELLIEVLCEQTFKYVKK